MVGVELGVGRSLSFTAWGGGRLSNTIDGGGNLAMLLLSVETWDVAHFSGGSIIRSMLGTDSILFVSWCPSWWFTEEIDGTCRPPLVFTPSWWKTRTQLQIFSNNEHLLATSRFWLWRSCLYCLGYKKYQTKLFSLKEELHPELKIICIKDKCRVLIHFWFARQGHDFSILHIAKTPCLYLLSMSFHRVI